MRDIKFRGKIKGSNTGEHALDWAYGDLVKELSTGKCFIYDLSHFDETTLLKDVLIEVDPKTVGQYTGLKDKNGKEIYEGDILSYKHIKYTDCSKEKIEAIEEEVLIGLITYRPLASIIKPYSENVMCLGYDNINKECLVIDLESEELEVVGNIYENPELLEKGVK